MQCPDCHSRQAAASESGFVLADAVAALFVLASVSATLTAALVLASRQGQTAEASATALVLAQRCMNDTAGDTETISQTVGGRSLCCGV